MIDTPLQYNPRPPGVTWAADNGCFSGKWKEAHWWSFLERHAAADDLDRCLFATAPDIVGNAWRSHFRSWPYLARIRDLGYPVAYVAQDGLQRLPVPWYDFDVLFIGGTDAFKLGQPARRLIEQAHERGKPVHMGRVNSAKRWHYAKDLGCASVDGTFLRFSPTENLARMRAWDKMAPDPSPALIGRGSV